MELTLKDLWTILKNSIFYCIIGAVILGAAVCTYTAFGVNKVYRSTTEYVLVLENGAVFEQENTSVNQLNNYLVVAAKSINTLSSYLMNEKTMTMVLEHIEKQHAADPTNEAYMLDYMYSASSVPFTFARPALETDVVFHISCNALSAKDSLILMDALTAIINERSEKILNGVFAIDVSTDAKMGTLVSPNILRNTIIGALVGALIPFIFVLLRTAFDTRINKEEDLKEKFTYPVLGQIPHI